MSKLFKKKQYLITFDEHDKKRKTVERHTVIVPNLLTWWSEVPETEFFKYTLIFAIAI
jgi:hypothetical protein